MEDKPFGSVPADPGPDWIGQEPTWKPMTPEMRAKVEELKRQYREELTRNIIRDFLKGGAE